MKFVVGDIGYSDFLIATFVCINGGGNGGGDSVYCGGGTVGGGAAAPGDFGQDNLMTYLVAVRAAHD